jgi:hypothetical protein
MNTDRLEGAKSFKQHRQWKKKWLRDEVYDIRHNPTRTEDWSSGCCDTPTVKELDNIIVQFVLDSYKKSLIQMRADQLNLLSVVSL